jgi:hypothetical protein
MISKYSCLSGLSLFIRIKCIKIISKLQHMIRVSRGILYLDLSMFYYFSVFINESILFLYPLMPSSYSLVPSLRDLYNNP